MPLLSRLLAMGVLTTLSGCANQSTAISHALGNPVHVVATAPPTCPVCALYSVHRSNVVRLRTDSGQGAGVGISTDGDILTSAHVVAGFSEVRVGTHGGRDYPGTVAFADADMDLAVVRVETPGTEWPAVELEPDDSLPIGSKIYVIGHPVGLGWTVTQGIVSGRRRIGEAAATALLQTDAAISPGNSGGPMLDEHGHLVAIVRSKLVGPGIENVSFGVPMSAVVEFLKHVPARPDVKASAPESIMTNKKPKRDPMPDTDQSTAARAGTTRRLHSASRGGGIWSRSRVE